MSAPINYRAFNQTQSCMDVPVLNMEQRANIKFCFKIGKTATETYNLIKQVYGDDALSRGRVFEWFARFRDGREELEDDAHTGRPKNVRTQEMIEKVKELLLSDRRTTLKMMEETLNINRETIRLIVTEDLGKRKLCARFVPHVLTDEQKKHRKDACKDLITTADANRNFLDSIVTGDESWCYQYDPETKRQSMEWRSSTSPRKQKFRFEKSKTKVMLITFFDSTGIIHKEFVPPGQTINKDYYKEVLQRLVKRIHRVRPQFHEKGSWFLLHDNARPHTALLVKEFLANNGIVELHHPPYSPDLSPPDFFLFPKVKTSLKGQRFANVEDITKNVTAELGRVKTEDFKACFQNLYERWNKCVASGGTYFEKY